MTEKRHNSPPFAMAMIVLARILTFMSILSSARCFIHPQGIGTNSKTHPVDHRCNQQQLEATAEQPSEILDSASLQNESQIKVRTLGLLSFDLDDTLFPCGPVVAEANEAMIEAILKLGYRGVTNDDVLKATKSIRSELSKTDTPITYTNLRIAAIQAELEAAIQSLGGEAAAIHSSVSEKIFDIWLQARHDAAEKYLYPDCIDMLKRIKKDHPNAIVAAVTNGRGDPLDMGDTIYPYFDYTVSGEDEDVFPNRKPHRGIFDATLAKYKGISGKSIVDCDSLSWIHVGDDLANDVGASAACGAKAVWYDMDDEAMADDVDIDEAKKRRANNKMGATPFYSTASAEEVQRRKEMAKKAQESVSRRIATLAELPDAITSILEENA